MTATKQFDINQVFDMQQIPVDRRPPEGMVWLCPACGNIAVDLFGMIGPASPGWDSSCMLHATPVPLR